jgi:hypothetical protein
MSLSIAFVPWARRRRFMSARTLPVRAPAQKAPCPCPAAGYDERVLTRFGGTGTVWRPHARAHARHGVVG